jgi:hypothetical protein
MVWYNKKIELPATQLTLEKYSQNPLTFFLNDVIFIKLKN